MKTTLLVRSLVVLAILIPALSYQTFLKVRTQSLKDMIFVDSLPSTLGNWQSTSVELSEDEKSMLKSPSVSQRIYFNSQTGDRVQILLLQVSNTQNAHDPRFCMTGSGYGIDSENRIQVDWANKSHTPSEISRADFRKEEEKVAMFFWLQTPDGTIADMSAGFKLEGIKRALKGESTKGVAIRVICLTRQSSVEATPVEAAIGLWRQIDDTLDVEHLAKEM
jgi:hypothetical protein